MTALWPSNAGIQASSFLQFGSTIWPSTNYKLSFISAHQAEATEVLNTLPAYLAHWNGTWVYKYFKSENFAKARNYYWDQKSRSIRSTKEKMMDDLMMCDTEWHSQVEITNLEEVVDPDNPAVEFFLPAVWTQPPQFNVTKTRTMTIFR
jgi:hypothetical protein